MTGDAFQPQSAISDGALGITRTRAAIDLLATVPLVEIDLDVLSEAQRLLLPAADPNRGRLRTRRAVIRLNGQITAVLPRPCNARGGAANQALHRLTTTASDDQCNCNPLSVAAKVHFLLIHWHPFTDGNGRLARSVAASVLQRVGYVLGADPRVFCWATVRDYYTAIRAMETGQPLANDGWNAFNERMVRWCFISPGLHV
jgi:prophage maintenance system killer protein